MSILQRWNDYQPSKAALAWSAVGGIVLTVAVGFTWGGWVTGGTAAERAADAAQEARAELASVICIDSFRNADTARAQYQEFVELSSFRQRQFVEQAEWAVLPDGQRLDRRAATLCAEQIAEIDPESLPNPVAATMEEPETVVQ